MLQDISQKIRIPENVTVEIANGTVKVKGQKGENERTLIHRNVKIQVDDRNILITAKKPTKREKTITGTFKAHIKNLIKGVDEGFTYKLKVCSTHFPMTATADGREVVIKNFLGEKIPRKCNIPEGVSVKVEGSMITVEGVDIEKAGKAASLIEQSTRITKRDRRVFQDGCYIVERPGR